MSAYDYSTHTEPLPAKLRTLEFLPRELHDHYPRRDFNGDFVLGFVASEDRLSREAHIEAIAAGRVEMIPEGETLASLAEQKAQAAASKKAFEDALAAGERAQMEKQLADLAQREQKGTQAFREKEAAIRARGGR